MIKARLDTIYFIIVAILVTVVIIKMVIVTILIAIVTTKMIVVIALVMLVSSDKGYFWCVA